MSAALAALAIPTEIIVTDDCSSGTHLERLNSITSAHVVGSEKNYGLGANCNKGLSAASGEFILQMQDDWMPNLSLDFIPALLHQMTLKPEIGLVILNSHSNKSSFQLKEKITCSNGLLSVYTNNLKRDVQQVGQHPYSDWPHIKSKYFLNTVGYYKTNCKMWQCELDYSQRINRQSTVYVGDVSWDTFVHIGEEWSFNNPWKKTLIIKLENIGAGWIYKVYIKLKKRFL
tara:strand:- start:51 stop:740 length:690 start_codon:yes stop_codon:yes gene_type:complete